MPARFIHSAWSLTQTANLGAAAQAHFDNSLKSCVSVSRRLTSGCVAADISFAPVAFFGTAGLVCFVCTVSGCGRKANLVREKLVGLVQFS